MSWSVNHLVAAVVMAIFILVALAAVLMTVGVGFGLRRRLGTNELLHRRKWPPPVIGWPPSQPPASDRPAGPRPDFDPPKPPTGDKPR